MEDEHREAIRRNISSLVNQTDLETMRSALFEKGIFTEHNMETYNDTSSTQLHRKRCMYNDIMRRGPRAFNILLETLEENGYWDLVRMLDPNSILNSFSSNSRPHVEEKSSFLSISEKKTESELLNKHPPPETVLSNGVGAAASNNNNQPELFVVKKSERFVEDDPSNDIKLYTTRGKHRGVVLLLSYVNFKNNVAEHRAGADRDANNLKHLFDEMGFKILSYTDLDLEETHRTLKQLAGVLSPAPECVFVVVSSHGYERAGSADTDIRCHDGRLISLMEIISYFSNRRLPLLADVPKVFVFQTCRGALEDYVAKSAAGAGPAPLREPAATDGTALPPGPRAGAARDLPLYTNMLLVQSTLPGLVSRRDPELGSWYIQMLCEVFAARAHEVHVDKLFTLVDERLQERFHIQTSSVDRWGFNRRLYLHPGLAE